MVRAQVWFDVASDASFSTPQRECVDRIVLAEQEIYALFNHSKSPAHLSPLVFVMLWLTISAAMPFSSLVMQWMCQCRRTCGKCAHCRMQCIANKHRKCLNYSHFSRDSALCVPCGCYTDGGKNTIYRWIFDTSWFWDEIRDETHICCQAGDNEERGRMSTDKKNNNNKKRRGSEQIMWLPNAFLSLLAY